MSTVRIRGIMKVKVFSEKWVFFVRLFFRVQSPELSVHIVRFTFLTVSGMRIT